MTNDNVICAGSMTTVRFPWPGLLTLSSAAFVTVTAELLPASVLLPMSRSFDVAPSTAGLLVSAWALTVAGLSLPLVRLTRRLPRQRILVGALSTFAVATALTAVAPSFEIALASRTIAAAAHGLFWSMLVVTAAGMVPPERVGRAVSIVLAGPAIAGVLGVPAGAAVGAAIGWRTPFAALAILMLAAAVAVARLRVQDASPQPASGERPAGLGVVVLLAVAGALVLTGHFMLYTYVAPLLQDVAGLDAGSRAVMLTAFGAAGVVGIALSGPVSDRWPRQALTGVVVAFAVSAWSLRLLDRGLPTAVIAVAVWGVLIGLLPPVFQTRIVRSAPPAAQAVAGALAITVLNLGIASGAAAGGLVLDTRGASSLPFAAALVISVAALGLVSAHALATLTARRHKGAQPITRR